MKNFFIIGCIYGFLAVAAGAFGAHALKARLSSEMLMIFETGARYHLMHAAVLLAVGLVPFYNGWSQASGWFFTLGILIFSGSLYILALSGVRIWGAVTPIGGLMLLAGWASLAMAAIKSWK